MLSYDTFLHTNLADATFLRTNAQRWCRGDAAEAGRGDGEEQHRVAKK